MKAGGRGTVKLQRTAEEEVISSCSKRCKVDDNCVEAPDSSDQLQQYQLNLLPPNSVSYSSANTTTCSTSSPTDIHKDQQMRSTDLEHNDSETEISTFIIGQSRETSPSAGEVCRGDSGVELMEPVSPMATKKKDSSPINSEELKTRICMPSSAKEIKEFFAEAEKRMQKRFAEKYNYDIVNDKPLEGTYEWIRLK